ncbi:DUF4339 domain-containing protein [Bradyrhizobium sp.]|uniref:DUF4339 domain-containing protein n=1 Tax=Bradyrhizobium sp. TaxID=376 RepID=UPI0023845C45|nr:DUF4339 domain-containing protein [Bradyrhizobium sp.]MDE2379468.1 DUF4339 domain-containing protein [Bradyrhizobium sp.]
MASWFYASEGKQQGPFPEVQFRDLIVQGVVRPDTLVWTEGMAGWQRAAEIPGLLGGGAPPAVSHGGGMPTRGAGPGGILSVDVGLFDLLGRSIVYVIGMLLVIPAPWVATWFYKWFASRLQVPGRPNVGFEGQAMDIWYVFMATALLSYSGASGSSIMQLLGVVVQGLLAWMILRWIAGNLSSNGQRLPISFKGSAIGYVGWYLLLLISAVTIVGWAWVVAFWMRWICSNIEGTRREIVFNGTGLQILWRTLVFAIGCSFLIPIPWVLRWYTRWYVSQFALVERGAMARA